MEKKIFCDKYITKFLFNFLVPCSCFKKQYSEPMCENKLYTFVFKKICGPQQNSCFKSVSIMWKKNL